MIAYLASITSLEQVIDMASQTRWSYGGKAVDSSYPSEWHFNATTADEPIELLRRLHATASTERP